MSVHQDTTSIIDLKWLLEGNGYYLLGDGAGGDRGDS